MHFMLEWIGITKGKSARMALGRSLRKHILKIVLVVTVVYLFYALSSLGSLGADEKLEALQQKHEKEQEMDRKRDALKRKHAENRAHIDKTNREDEVIEMKTEPEQSENDAPIIQPIDPDEAHRKKRLRVLKEIYALPYEPDSTYKLNESLSRTLDLDRPPPDLRPLRCEELKYNIDDLPTISVIFPVHNEALSMILRTVHSVINHTPDKLLKDIIIVDDKSKNENLKGPLDRYISMLPSKVKIVRNEKREGLIRSRMKGAAVARGDVLLFQDSHTEFGVGWAEPALEYIKNHPSTVIQPTVQELSPTTISWPKRSFLDYTQLWRGAFLWDMRFAWNLVPDSYTGWKLQDYDPFPNPILVGCSIIIQKDFFYKIGGFDSGLEVWGGENLELSFRTWMCGGKMVIHPCSQIAHVFKPFSYSFDGDKEHIVAQNSIRVIETWMDEYRDYFYAYTFNYDFKRTELDNKKLNGLREHRALREKLGCKSFDWYLKNVLPEMPTPSKDNLMFGEVQNIASSLCWKVESDGWIISTKDCFTYSRLKHDAQFGVTKDGHIMFGHRCVAVHAVTLLLRVVACHEPGYHTKGFTFEHDYSEGQTVGKIQFLNPNVGKTYCLQQITNPNETHNGKQMPQTIDCKENEYWQLWAFTYKFDFDLVPPSPQ